MLRRFDDPAREILAAIGLSELAGREVATLPYGHKRVLEIGLALALEPTLLLLDEPTAGLSVDDAARIVDVVPGVAERRTIVLVEHNMGVVAQLSRQITVLQRGRVLAEGTYEALRANPAVIEAYLGGAA
jgi:branched-chain amino acid transport system ATP-binding protein